MSGVRRSDDLERRKLQLMRQAATIARYRTTIGGVDRKQRRQKPITLPGRCNNDTEVDPGNGQETK